MTKAEYFKSGQTNSETSSTSGDLTILSKSLLIFDFDDRLFFGISYGDCGMYSDVLDTKGNYYLRTWYCSEGNNAEIQEDALFNENKTFTIGNWIMGTVL